MEEAVTFTLGTSSCSCSTLCGNGRYFIAGTDEGDLYIRDLEVDRTVSFGAAFTDGKTVERIACTLVPQRLVLIAALAYPPNEKRAPPLLSESVDPSPERTDAETSEQVIGDTTVQTSRAPQITFGSPELSIFFVPLVSLFTFSAGKLYHLFNYETVEFLSGNRELLDYFNFSLSPINRHPNRFWLSVSFFSAVNVYEV